MKDEPATIIEGTRQVKSLIIAREELTRYTRGGLRLVAVMFASFLAGSMGSSIGGAPAIANFAASIIVFIVIGSALVTVFIADTIAGEAERGTLELLLVRPVAYKTITTGKFVAGYICMLPAIAVALLTALNHALSLSGSVPSLQIVASTGYFLIASVAFVMSLGICLSAGSKKSASATVVGFLLGFIIGFILYKMYERMANSPNSLVVTASVLIIMTTVSLSIAPKILDAVFVTEKIYQEPTKEKRRY